MTAKPLTNVLVAGILLAAVVGTGSSVLVAPHHIFMDHRVRSGTIELYNPSDQTEEVSIETVFGYPATDSAGRLFLYTAPDRVGAADARSAAGWIRAFPRRMTIRPGERQTVRLLAEPPAALPDGEYWTRVVVHSKGQQLPVAGVSDTTTIQVGLDLEVRTVIALTYRKGEVSTGVQISELAASIVDDSLLVRPLLRRQSDAAYIGLLRTELVDAFGNVVREWENQVAVYYALHRQLAFGLGDLPEGPYWVRVTVATDRSDVEPENLLPAQTVRDSVLVVR